VVAEVALADEPFVVLFDDDAGGEPDQGAVVGAPLCQGVGLAVGDEGAIDDVGEVSFEAASCFCGALALCELAVEVCARCGSQRAWTMAIV
jgi:hypothetical protein